MADIIKGRFGEPREDSPKKSPDQNREKKIVVAMREGVFYDLNPPTNIQGKLFVRVQCEYQVPNNPNEYVVRGVPQGETKMESSVLRFGDKGISVTESADQNSD